MIVQNSCRTLKGSHKKPHLKRGGASGGINLLLFDLIVMMSHHLRHFCMFPPSYL